MADTLASARSGAASNSSERNSSLIRFAFGRNWQAYLKILDEEKIAAAQASVRELLGRDRLDGLTFLDIGSGSGVFSLAARNLGAIVRSIDYDSDSVQCTRLLKEKFYPGDPYWRVEQGSVLDPEFRSEAERHDIVYSWGVLHHTGDMWTAIDNALEKTADAGQVAISIYNDQGWLSRYWTGVKRLYHANVVVRWLIILVHAPYLVVARYAVRLAGGRRRLDRGMSYWYDMIDWLGGMPFEVARPEQVIFHVQSRGFRLTGLKTCGGRSGCNEFVFVRSG